jgi:hypothetical protein
LNDLYRVLCPPKFTAVPRRDRVVDVDCGCQPGRCYQAALRVSALPNIWKRAALVSRCGRRRCRGRRCSRRGSTCSGIPSSSRAVCHGGHPEQPVEWPSDYRPPDRWPPRQSPGPGVTLKCSWSRLGDLVCLVSCQGALSRCCWCRVGGQVRVGSCKLHLSAACLVPPGQNRLLEAVANTFRIRGMRFTIWGRRAERRQETREPREQVHRTHWRHLRADHHRQYRRLRRHGHPHRRPSW